MTDFDTSGHCWSWRSCFTTVKHNKSKIKKRQSLESYSSPAKNSISNEHKHYVKSNINNIKNGTLSNDDRHHFTENHNVQQTIDDINTKTINQKPLPTIRTTHLDVITEDSNEENSDEYDETTQSFRLYYDSELINDANDLYLRLFDLSKTGHITIQFDDNRYLLQEFIRQIDKLKIKIDDTKRASVEVPRYAELLEARYSTLLATIESLSLLLKIGQISSYYSFVNHLIFSIEQRIEQLNKYVKPSSSNNLHQKRQDLNDDDFLSYRSAFSSYEHLLTMLS
ncbi:unnamed protein product [Rotaria magnacalcarata]|uniref:Uncharacterized protein n=1 Tax=Rotaria magnacalcarata TaxID=392030 RepID=A0A816VVX1_9BILA|nr:unnamed protein product [Rotaria magnacalcarata]CAF1613948.1 unnamed protein product [Rotaria magnacalcarata]CAF2066055.1 unnamed protein product [Rotaria magnacalcarata]CAF2082210.1 unnamed protein product [Rotaria magnacalcarata]CAF2125166.1 unnamed protein product [Rotaria magnacalcarata]